MQMHERKVGLLGIWLSWEEVILKLKAMTVSLDWMGAVGLG